MPRALQYCFAWGLAAAGAALLAFLPAPPFGRAEENLVLPRVDKLEHQAYTETIPGNVPNTKVTFDVVPIPGGAYLMGSPKDEPGRSDDEGPQHPVQIKPFWMGKYEVTWDEYDIWRTDMKIPVGEAAGKKGKNKKPEPKDVDAVTRPTPPYGDPTFSYGHDSYPVICVTHHAAMEYCRWLSKKTGKMYRLPTEAEWEWAARAGTKTPYFFGDDAKKLEDYAWSKENSEDSPHEVGKKKPNPWGLYDIYGNASEWCVDRYEKNAYSQFPADKLTLGPVLLPTANRFPDVARGGSWNEKADRCRSATRRTSEPDWIQLDPNTPKSIWWLTSAEFVGFRVVRAVEEQDNLKGIRSKVTRESD
jgi:formylglycine-generating enzyme required for sulfatase activity